MTRRLAPLGFLLVAAIAGACAHGQNDYQGGTGGTGNGAHTTASVGGATSDGGHGADAGTGGASSSGSSSSVASSSSTGGGTCNQFCNGCACPSTECIMCCVAKGMNDVCTNKLCGCF